MNSGLGATAGRIGAAGQVNSSCFTEPTAVLANMGEPAVQVAPAPYVTIALAAAITGLSEKAIRRKIEDGKWLAGREFVRSPDGGIFISIRGYQAWIERGSTP